MNPLDYEIARWRRYSDSLGFAKTEHAEKDYLQELLLLYIFSGKLAKGAVFRGGTAISKVYGSGRFSEDIDLILDKEVDAHEVKDDMAAVFRNMNLRYVTEYKMAEYRNMLKYEAKINGPIYAIAKNQQAKQSVRIDLNTYERPLLGINRLQRTTIYEDIRPYTLSVLSPKELLADKIKAVLERTEPVARDIYDAWIIMKKFSVKPDVGIIDRKMREFGKNKGEIFSVKELSDRVKTAGKRWKEELSRLMLSVPDYKNVSSEFLAGFA